MTKIFSIALLAAAVSASAQISVSGKAHLLFPTSSASWKSISGSATEAYEKAGKNNVGFNVGLSVRANLPTALFLMPELYYTTFKNEITDPVTNTAIEAKSNRVDLPVLVGYNLLGETLGIYAGPVASYNLSTDNQYADFKENAAKEFTVGYQLGAQAKISSYIVSARYEGSFSKDQRDFISSSTKQNIRYDNRPSLFMAGIGYQF